MSTEYRVLRPPCHVLSTRQCRNSIASRSKARGHSRVHHRPNREPTQRDSRLLARPAVRELELLKVEELLGPTQAPTAADDATDVRGSCLWAHGGMVSTLNDMRVWAESLATGSLLTPEVWAQATTDMVPFVFGGNYNGPGQWRYGLGFVESGGFFGAEGSFAGYESATMHSPELQTTIEVASTKLANAVTPPPIVQAIAMTVYGDEVDFGLTLEQALKGSATLRRVIFEDATPCCTLGFPPFGCLPSPCCFR